MKEVFGGVRIVTFSTRDLPAARAFYVDRLGLRLISEDAGHVAVNVGTFRLRLEAASEARPAARGGAALTFRVEDLGKTSRELDARGIGYEQHTSRRGGDSLETHDPDGRRVLFVERL